MLKKDSTPCFPASLNAIIKVLIITIDLIQKLYHNIKPQQFQTTWVVLVCLEWFLRGD
jgi:hypothetical protein